MRRKPVVVVGVAAVVLGVGVLAAGQAGAQETPQWPDVPGFSLSDLPGFSAFGGDSDGDSGDDSGDSGSGSDVDADDQDAADQDSAGRDSDDQDSADRGADDQDADGGSSVAGGSDGGRAHRSGADRGGADRGGADRGGADRGGADRGGADRGGADRGAADARGVRRPAADQGGQRAAADQAHVRTRAGHAVPKQAMAPDGAAAVAQRPADVEVRPHAAVPVRQQPALIQPGAAGGLIAAARRNVTAADLSSSPDAPFQRQILALVNQNRREHGCGALSLDHRLIEAAARHAADMARHDYFAHQSRDGQGAGDRVTRAGYQWRHYGENIARGVKSPYAVVDGWMHSPEHRHNILDCTLDQMGIGLAIAGDRYRTVYWVQDMATPM